MSDRLNKFYSTQVGWWGSSFVHSVEHTASQAVDRARDIAQQDVHNMQNATNAALAGVKNVEQQAAHSAQWVQQKVAHSVSSAATTVWNDAKNIASGASALGKAL